MRSYVPREAIANVVVANENGSARSGCHTSVAPSSCECHPEPNRPDPSALVCPQTSLAGGDGRRARPDPWEYIAH